LQQRHNLAESMRKLQVTRNCKIALQNLANLILEILSILESIQCLGNISRATGSFSARSDEFRTDLGMVEAARRSHIGYGCARV
jgi:hypothetical protein